MFFVVGLGASFVVVQVNSYENLIIFAINSQTVICTQNVNTLNHIGRRFNNKIIFP